MKMGSREGRRRTSTLLLVTAMLASALAASMPGVSADPPEYDPDAPGTFIVVAPGGWEDSLRPYLDWRGRTLVQDVLFIAYEEAVSGSPGHDAPAKLKAYLDYARSQVPAPAGLLLVGDADVIPVRNVFTDITGDGNLSDPINLRWTDDYYAYGSEADWDSDGDTYYGEDKEVLTTVREAFADMAGDAMRVGRIPASTTLELERFVDKLVAYERSPPEGDWYTSALLVSGLMDVPNHLDNPYTPLLDGGYELFSDNSFESHSKLRDLLPDRFSTEWVYDYPRLEGGDWNLSVDTMDHASVTAAFDRGHSVVAMNGHGWTDGSGLAHYNGSGYSTYFFDWSTAFDYRDADAAANGGRLPWVYVAACYVGDVTVEDDRTLERLVMNPDGGSIGLVAGNGENYKGESIANGSYGNWFLERNFWRNYFQVGPGAAMHRTKAAYLDLVGSDGVPHIPLFDAYYAADYLSHNLLGDPFTRVWTDVPGTLAVGGTEYRYWTDPHTYSVRMVGDDGMGVPGATVHVTDGADDVHKALTDDDGWAHLPLSDDKGYALTATADNRLPLEGTLFVDAFRSDLSVDHLSFEAPLVDGVPSPLAGEAVNVTAAVMAAGEYDYQQARVRFSVSDDGETFEDLIPDAFAAVTTRNVTQVTRSWDPPEAGEWWLRVEVDPEGALPNVDDEGDVVVQRLVVRGPPVWDDAVKAYEIVCGDAPGGHLDLRTLLSDPDTPLDEISVSASVEDRGEGTEVYLDDRGILWACTSHNHDLLELTLVADDGTFTDTMELSVLVERGLPALRVVQPAPQEAVVGATSVVQLEVEVVGRGEPFDVFPSYDPGDLNVTVDDEWRVHFTPDSPGMHHLRVGIVDALGNTRPDWQGALVVFDVDRMTSAPPEAVGWGPVRIAGGEEVVIQLPARDPEGDTILYSLVGDGGLDAELDNFTGELTLRPSRDDVGAHSLHVQLMDGHSTVDQVLEVEVTEPPVDGAHYALAAVMLVLVLAMLAAFMWSRRLRLR